MPYRIYHALLLTTTLAAFSQEKQSGKTKKNNSVVEEKGLIKGVANGIPNSSLLFMAIGSFFVKDFGKYQAAIGPNRDAIRSDFPNYTNISPVILVSEIVR